MIHEPGHRVGYTVFADNTRYSKSKKLDAIGFLHDDCPWPGKGYVLEVKERQAGSRFPFTIFDREDNEGMDQAGHLQFVHDSRAFALLWFQEIRSKRRGKDKAALFTWGEWLLLRRDPPVREFKHAEDRDYKSVSLDDIIERYPWTEMIDYKGQWWSGLEAKQGFKVLPLLAHYGWWDPK
jgi:hypothetical protein